MKKTAEPKKKYGDIIIELKKIKQKGYIKTKRRGPTGVGMTLESLVGIQENNISGPNGHQTELKSTRKTSMTPLTIFSKSPLPKGINQELCENFGKSTNRKKQLYTTINAVTQNRVYGEPGFRLVVHKSKIAITHTKDIHMSTPYWDKKTLQEAFERKYSRHLLYVHAESKGRGIREEFHYTTAWLIHGFSFSRFVKLLKEGHIKVDIRVGLDANGKPHDHGTAFRIPESKFDRFFATRRIVME